MNHYANAIFCLLLSASYAFAQQPLNISVSYDQVTGGIEVQTNLDGHRLVGITLASQSGIFTEILRQVCTIITTLQFNSPWRFFRTGYRFRHGDGPELDV